MNNKEKYLLFKIAQSPPATTPPQSGSPSPAIGSREWRTSSNKQQDLQKRDMKQLTTSGIASLNAGPHATTPTAKGGPKNPHGRPMQVPQRPAAHPMSQATPGTSWMDSTVEDWANREAQGKPVQRIPGVNM